MRHALVVVEARAEATRARRVAEIAARVKSLREQVAQDRRYLAQLHALSPDEAVQLIHEHTAQAEAQRLARDEMQKAAEPRAARFRRREQGPSRDVGQRL